VARALVSLRAHIDHLDLDKIVEEVHHCIKPFRLLLTPKARRSNTDAISGIVRFSTLVAASSIFRNAILSMDVDKTLCVFCKSCLAEVFREHDAKILLPHARLESKKENDILLNNNEQDEKYFTLVISGEIAVIRTLDDVEIGRGKCTVCCYQCATCNTSIFNFMLSLFETIF
jgi:ferredoxin